MSEPRPRSQARPAQRSRRADPARLLAYTVLRDVAGGAYANLVMPQRLRERRLTGRDAAFATELAYGTIRMRGLYDPILARAAERPVERIDAGVLDTLRLGAHQLLGMRVPSHAAVDSSVALARQVNGIGPAGFVNAVLRRVDERSLPQWLTDVTEGRAPLERLAIRHSHPEWIVKALRAALLGHGAAGASDIDEVLEALLAADNQPARVTLAARPGLIDPADLVEAAGRAAGDAQAASLGEVSPVAVVLRSGDPGALAAVRDGRAAVQDEGSQLIALALAEAPVEAGPVGAWADRPERWLDLCAGPGGKAGLLGALAVSRGASLLANEVSAHRAELVEQSLSAVRALAPGAVTVRVGDGREVPGEYPDGFTRVLVDAPCTGLGALRRRPEARWRRSLSDLAELSRLQRDLLAAGLDATAPGGVLAYATCSPHLNETVFAVRDVVDRRGDAELLDAPAVFGRVSRGQLEIVGEGPFVQLWPHVHGTDAMFCALIARR